MSNARLYSANEIKMREIVIARGEFWSGDSDTARWLATVAARDHAIAALAAERNKLLALYEERGEQQIRLAKERDEARAEREKLRRRVESMQEGLHEAFDRADRLTDERDEAVGLLSRTRSDVLAMADWCGGMEDDRVMRILHEIDAFLARVKEEGR